MRAKEYIFRVHSPQFDETMVQCCQKRKHPELKKY
ncbi:uncharacterized protein METZ01_LOCUS436297 [marine metagenome]|uniref:Uncharacterized protein n=1 Tax=marine metagenome TaxID=408172 RepID=A0A382YJK7_9ZZZZ